MPELTLDMILEHIVDKWFVDGCDCSGRESVYCFYCGKEQEHVHRDYSGKHVKTTIKPELHTEKCLHVIAKKQQRANT